MITPLAPPTSVAWSVEDDVDTGYANSTIPDVERAPVAGKPNGRYFPNTPVHDSDAKKASSRLKVCVCVCVRDKGSVGGEGEVSCGT